MITLDTSGVLALSWQQDTFHQALRAAFESDPGPYYVPAGILAEITFMLENRTSLSVEQSFLEDVRTGAYVVEWEAADVPRIQHLIQKYRSLRLGFSDAAVVACAERHGGRILTSDRRHFDIVVRGEPDPTLLPKWLP